MRFVTTIWSYLSGHAAHDDSTVIGDSDHDPNNNGRIDIRSMAMDISSLRARVGDIEGLFETLRAAMIELIQTAVTALNARIDPINARIDRINARIDRIGGELNQVFEGINAQIVEINENLTLLSQDDASVMSYETYLDDRAA